MGQTWDEMSKKLDGMDDALRDVALFLDELPQDLGKGSLNGWKVQLRERIRALGYA